jgi:uncharacterized integral membrane protein
VIRRLIGLIVSFTAAIVLVALAVANRHSAALVLDPFRPEAPALQIVLPFYAHIIGAVILGVLLGGVATWFNQGRWRNASRTSSDDARRWRLEAERLTRERDQSVAAAKANSSMIAPPHSSQRPAA